MKLSGLIAKATQGPWVLVSEETLTLRDPKDNGRILTINHLKGLVTHGSQRRDANENEANAKLVLYLVNNASKINELIEASEALYDNRLGWSEGRNPYAPPVFWEDLKRTLAALKENDEKS